MALCVFTLIAWIVIIVFSIMPKTISLVDMICLYIISLIISTYTFTILDVNLHILVVSRNVEKAWAVITNRTITVPLLLLISVNSVRFSALKRWCSIGGVFAMAMVCHVILTQMEIVIPRNWNFMYSILMFISFMIFVHLVAWWFVNLGGKEVRAV